MAGSYRHITAANNAFIGIELIDNLQDAYEALEQCWWMINHLTEGDRWEIFLAYRDGYARHNIPQENMKLVTFESFWAD